METTWQIQKQKTWWKTKNHQNNTRRPLERKKTQKLAFQLSISLVTRFEMEIERDTRLLLQGHAKRLELKSVDDHISSRRRKRLPSPSWEPWQWYIRKNDILMLQMIILDNNATTRKHWRMQVTPLCRRTNLNSTPDGKKVPKSPSGGFLYS